MRQLTSSESRVISLLLGKDVGESERACIRRSRLPRSTYQDVKHRAYAERWLRDRFIPSPVEFGFPVALFVVSRPFVDQVGILEARWRGEKGVVLLWGSPELAFGIAFLRSYESAANARERLMDPRLMQSSSAFTVDLSSPGRVPVYFDYEGAWNHLVGVRGLEGYPRGLGASLSNPRGRGATSLTVARKLVGRPTTDEDRRPLHRLGPFGLPRSQRRILEAGMIGYRVLLDPARTPTFGASRGDLLVLVQGRLGTGRSEREVLVRVNEAGVFPFLLVGAEGRVLMLLLGQRQSSSRGVGTSPMPVHGALLGLLGSLMKEVEVVREDWANLHVSIDHRYDLLLE